MFLILLNIIFVSTILAGRVIPESKNNSILFPLNTSWNISERNIAMLIEQFKPIEGYEGRYEVSNLGRVKSLPKIIKNGFYCGEIILKPALSVNYWCVVLTASNSKRSTRLIQHLVWGAFGDRPRNGYKLTVDHIDNNPLNNKIDNLQLLTNRENVSKGKLLKKTNNLPTGVSWNKRDKKYSSYIQINKKSYGLGSFDNVEDAKNIYKEIVQLLDEDSLKIKTFQKHKRINKSLDSLKIKVKAIINKIDSIQQNKKQKK